MNPILAEDIMRQRAHSSVIVLVTVLACMLCTTNRASAADGITVIVPVNVTNLHEGVESVYTRVNFFAGSQKVGEGQKHETVVDRAVEQDFEVFVRSLDQDFLNADTYSIQLLLAVRDDSGSRVACFLEVSPTLLNYQNYASDHVCTSEKMKITMKTYAPMEGPISDLIPE